MKFMDYVKNNKVVCGILGFSLFLNVWISGANSITTSDLNSAENHLEFSQNENKKLEDENEKLEKENKELKDKVEQAKPWFEMKEEERIAEQKRLEQEKAEREEQERLQKEKEEQERLAKEKAEQEERERKEKQGYETGITYNQLARNPQEYKGEKVKFKGRVLQVMEGESYVALRLGVNGSYDNVMFVIVPSNLMEQRILEDDYITVYGVSTGIYTYTTVMGAEMSIPSMKVDKLG